MNMRYAAARLRKLRRRLVWGARRRTHATVRLLLVRPGRRVIRPVVRTSRRLTPRVSRACRMTWKRSVRALAHAWGGATMRRTRRRAWRYTVHHPLHWARKYGWWVWKQIRARNWIYRATVYKIYHWQGVFALTMTRAFDAGLRGTNSPRTVRRYGALVFIQLLRVVMPRFPRTLKRPPLYQEMRGIHLKERGRSYEQSFQGPWGRLRYQRALDLGKQKKVLMWEAYTRVAKPVVLNVPYVYVALHFQPERTTSSLGGPFADQYLLVDMLARCIPAGWKVYVKEHPSQFYPPFCGERSRHADFYTDLRQLPNVELVSLSTSSFQLIDHARAVATVTGTVGWEAIVRGVPALVFGSPWYRACDGVWLVPTEQALLEALNWIQAGMRPDYRKVRLFILALEQVCARAGLGYGTPDEAELGLPHEETVDRLSAVLHRHWNYMRDTPPPLAPRASVRRDASPERTEMGA